MRSSNDSESAPTRERSASRRTSSSPWPEPSARNPTRESADAQRAAGERSPSASRPAYDARCDLAVPLPVEVERRGVEASLAYVTNLSASGACLHLAARLAVGDAVLLRVALPDQGEPLAARGRVSWCEDPPAELGARFVEAGIRFEVLSEADRARIAHFVRSGEPAHPGAG